MHVIDTNVLLYAADRMSPEHGKCSAMLESLRNGTSPWYLTWGITYEFIRVITHPMSPRKPVSAADAWRFVTDLLASPNAGVLSETPRHAEVADEIFRTIPGIKGSLVFDARTAILMKEHGITRIITRDTDFFRFPFLEVIDPLQAPPGLVKKRRVAYRTRGRRAAGATA